MKILVTGVSGFVGGRLAPLLQAQGHDVRGLSRQDVRGLSHPGGARPDRSRRERGRMDEIPVLRGDAVSGQGLEEALADVEVAYYLIHSMEHSADGSFPQRERRSAENFARAASRAGVRRIVYLGGFVPSGRTPSAHLASRLAVEQTLLEATDDSVAFRASIVIGARSRSFRFLVRLVERLPLLVVPAWRDNRTAPIDERDVTAYLAAAATAREIGGRSLDLPGPDVVSYGELIELIRDELLLSRPVLSLSRVSATPIASRVSSVIAGEDHELIGPLMEGLDSDLLPRDEEAAELLPVRRHRLSRAIEHALGEWERVEPLRAR